MRMSSDMVCVCRIELSLPPLLSWISFHLFLFIKPVGPFPLGVTYILQPFLHYIYYL